MKSHVIWLLIPLWLFFLIAPFTPEWDMTISKCFFQSGHFYTEGVSPLIFTYGPWPGLALGIISFGLLAVAFSHQRFRNWVKPLLFLLSVLVIFEGFVVHILFKDHWGRPRPKQVIEFGGNQPFRPYYSPNFFDQQEPAKSFPCGHCGMGFYFFALALLGWRHQSKILFWMGLCLGFFLGFALSWARMAQGGHFFTDILASFLMIGYGIYFSYHFFYSSSSVSGSNSSSF